MDIISFCMVGISILACLIVVICHLILGILKELKRINSVLDYIIEDLEELQEKNNIS